METKNILENQKARKKQTKKGFGGCQGVFQQSDKHLKLLLILFTNISDITEGANHG